MMRIKVEVERGKGLVSTFLRGLLIEIWIGVFISIVAFYFGCPFRVVVLSSLSLSRKFRTKFPKISKGPNFPSALAKSSRDRRQFLPLRASCDSSRRWST